MEGLLKHTNQNIVVSNNFKKYRTYLWSIKEYEFKISKNLCILYVVKGVLDITSKYDLEKEIMQNKKTAVYKGDFYILNPNMCFEIESSEENLVLVLEINLKYFNNYFHFNYKKNIFKSINDAKIEDSEILMGKIYLESLSNEWEASNTDKKVNSLLSNMDIEKRIQKEQRYTGKTIEQVIYDIAYYIDLNILDLSYNNHNLEDLSDMFNINYCYLSRKFSEFIGLNYSDYLLYRKLEISIDLLMNSDDKILDISNKSGFKSVKLLNRGFNKVFNITPSRFRTLTEDMREFIKCTELYLDNSFQEFISDIEKSEKNLLIDELKKDYLIEMNQYINKSNGSDTIHINNLIDIRKSLSIISDVIKNYSGKNIVIDIGIKNKKIYLIDYNDEYIELNNLLLNFLISKLNKYEYNVDLIINYSIGNKSNVVNSFEEDINMTIDNISKIVGKNGLNRYLFGLKVLNINDLILNNRTDTLNATFITFDRIIKQTFSSSKKTWILSMNSILDLDNIKEYEKIIRCFESPIIYIIDLIFEEKDIFEIDNKDILQKLHEIEKYLNKYSDKKVLFGIKVNASSICESSNNYKFFKKKILQLLVKSKVNNHKIIYLNTIFKNSKNRYKVPHFYNEVGIKNREYYIYQFINSLKGDVVYVDKHIVVVSKFNDIMIFIIGDYRDCIRLVEKGISIDSYVEYNIKLENIIGKYKILNYKIEYLSNNTNLYKYLNLMSSEEVKYIEKYNMPELKVNLVNIDEYYEFKIRKDIDSIYYIKMKNIG